MYFVTLKAEIYSSGATFSFEQLPDAMDFIERSIANAVPGDNGFYPSATIIFIKDDNVFGVLCRKSCCGESADQQQGT